MATIQKPSRDEYKRINNVVKTVLKVKYDTRSSTNVEECERDLIEIITMGCKAGTPLNYYKKKCVTYENEMKAQRELINDLINKNWELSYKLKNKKWWQFWR